MSLFAVRYTYSDDVATRDEGRPRHRDFLRSLNAQGVVRASGPLDDGAAALLVVESDSEQDVLRILDTDPFAEHGVVAERSVHRWDVVIGGLAEPPRP